MKEKIDELVKCLFKLSDQMIDDNFTAQFSSKEEEMNYFWDKFEKVLVSMDLTPIQVILWCKLHLNRDTAYLIKFCQIGLLIQLQRA